MNEQHFRLTSEEKRGLAMHAISEAPEGYEVVVRPFVKIRTTPQNSMHWANITGLLQIINETVSRVSEATGYTPIEVKREIARFLPAEQVAILYARTPEVCHEVMKAIANIPTSTRLGTKQFSDFETVMENTMNEIIGQIRSFEGIANG